MGRMYGPGKGKSGSTLPYLRRPPKWLANVKAIDVEATVVALAKKGLRPSQIGELLRDTKGIPKVKFITGKYITRILSKSDLLPEIPENLFCLIRKAINLRKHLEKSKRDKDGKFRLINIESKIHRLSRYYKKSRKLPSNWKYKPEKVAALVS